MNDGKAWLLFCIIKEKEKVKKPFPFFILIIKLYKAIIPCTLTIKRLDGLAISVNSVTASFHGNKFTLNG